MTELILIIISTVLVNNFVLVRFLGLCPFMGVSKKLEGAIGLSLATVFVLTLSSAVSYLLDRFVLMPFDLLHIRSLAFILVIAGVVQGTEIVVRHSSPLLYQLLGIYLPLITTNCAVLGVTLLNVYQSNSFLQSVFFGFGASTGFGLVLVLFAALRERLVAADVPVAFRGAAIALITAALMSLAFLGFAGLD